ncbi:proline and serine-rich protein 3 isoform X4 [Lates japonicus]|uniref:Proline and serine-rich protein 3 isoform X4 n=1 Tax=Lates japonicus TaxID=270547 RepID=A0AAD3MYG8_LATJO|nr:proline and serine-rich protein 3 isoform X4 [Lates japonicus]
MIAVEIVPKILSDTSQVEFDDTEILRLQEQASRLLLRGLDEPVRRPFIPSLIKSTTVCWLTFAVKVSSNSDKAVSSQKPIIPSSGPPTRPEEDILFQWRLRRKMEQAREWPPSLQHSSLHRPTLSWQAPSLSPSSAGGQAYKSTQPPEFSQKDSRPHIIASQSEANEAQRSCPPASGEEWPLHKKRSESNKKERAQTKESERNERKTAMPIRKQKKSTREPTVGPRSAKRSSLHQRLPKKVTPVAELQQQEGSQEYSSEGCTGDHAPPPSPIHTALGQVVSEVLFPTVDSSPARRTPVSLVSPPCTASAPLQSPVPPCNTHNSMEVISQLLQEAEDSDEKEFEDDPLLQVLRKQRKWVKEQISEVNSMLNEFLEE